MTMALSGVVVVMLVDYLREHQAWGWMRLVQGPSALDRTPGLQFAKIMGSGHGGGFGLRPSTTHQGLICLFDHIDRAREFMAGKHVQWRVQRAREHWIGLLTVTSSRGTWDGSAWGETHAPPASAPLAGTEPGQQPVASLTRASIKPSKASSFWRYSPAAQADLLKAPGCDFAIGLGETPLVRQCTFSLWRDARAMVDYAHSGAHATAIQAAYRNEFFSESMFVRMSVVEAHGRWHNPAQVGSG